MQLQTIRAEIDSPGWLNRLTEKYKRDQTQLRKIEKENRKKEVDQLVDKIATRLGKQDVTTEVREPTQTLEAEKPKPVEVKAIIEVIKEISETLETHAEIIEDLSDRVDKLEQRQPSQGAVKRDAITGRIEPSQRDIEIIESRFEQIGLTGEVRKIIRNPYIEGRFIG